MAFAVDWIGLSKPGFGPGQFVLATLGYYAILTGICVKLFRAYLTKEYSLKELTSLIRKNRIDILLTFVLFGIGVIIATAYVSSIYANGSNLLFYPPTAIMELPYQLRWIQPFFPHGVLFGLTSALAYGIFRFGRIGRFLSVIGCLGFMTSSIHLYNLVPSPFRDYAKAPFILAVILITIMMVTLPLKRRGIINLSLLMGGFLGIGLIIRQDLLIFILLPIVSIGFFLPSPLRKDFKLKGIVLVILIIMLLPQLSQTLIFKDAQKGPARVIGGLMSQMDKLLGISRPVYDYGHMVRDELIWAYPYAQAIIQAPAKTFDFADTAAEKGEVQRNFLWKVVLNFPADMLTRGYASLLRILELPFTYLLHPLGIKNQAIMSAYSVRAAILGILSGTSIFLVVIALLIISAHSLRLAFFSFFLVLFLGCYPALQFYGRHYFHLEFITWWAIGFTVQCMVLLLVRYAKQLKSKDNSVQFRLGDLRSIGLRRILIFGISSMVIVLMPLSGLRYYQNLHINKLLKQYDNVSLEPVAFTKKALANGNILFSIPFNQKDNLSNNVAVDYIVADFSNEHCRYNTIWPFLRYQLGNPDHPPGLDFSRLIKIDIDQSNVTDSRLIFPILATTLTTVEHGTNRNIIFSSRFAGIELPSSEASCLAKIYRIKDAGKLPLLLTIIPGSREPKYQRFGQETSSIYTVPSNPEVNLLEKILHANISPLSHSDIDFKADIVKFNANKWDIRGYAAYPCADSKCQNEKRLAQKVSAVDYSTDVNTDLVRTKKIKQTKGNYFMAQGKLYAGGVTFGLIKDDRTAGTITITKHGPFTVIIEVPEDGLYWVGIANELDWFTSLENRFEMNKIGWVEFKKI